MKPLLTELRDLSDKNYSTVQVIEFLREININPARPSRPLFIGGERQEEDEGKAQKLTWEDIIAEEPLTGEHWDDDDYDYDEDEDEWSEFGSSEEREAVEVEKTNADTFDTSSYELELENYPLGLEHYVIELPDMPLSMDSLYWENDHGRYLSEANAIRECIYAVLGYPTKLFTTKSHSKCGIVQIPSTPIDYHLENVSNKAFSGLLRNISESASVVRQLEIFSDPQVTENYFPQFDYVYTCGVVEGVTTQLKDDLLQFETDYQTTHDTTSILKTTQEITQLISPYGPLVSVLLKIAPSTDTRVNLLNELYDSIYLSETINDIKTERILITVFIQNLQDYFKYLNENNFCCGKSLPRILTPYYNSINRLSRLFDNLESSNEELVLSPNFNETPDLSGVECEIEQSFRIFENKLSNTFKNYLNQNGFQSIIKQHIDVYFMLDESGRISLFLEKVLDRIQNGSLSDLNRHTVSNELNDALVSNVAVSNVHCKVQKYEQFSIDLRLPLPNQKLETIITLNDIHKYNIIWNKLLKCKLALMKFGNVWSKTNHKIITVLNCVMTKFMLVLRMMSQQFLKQLSEDGANLLDLHSLFIEQALTSVTDQRVDAFIMMCLNCISDDDALAVPTNQVIGWLDEDL